MPYRCIIVENPANISVRNDQLIIRTDSEHYAAVEDISALLIESRQTNITAAALSRLGESGCSVFFCDEKHIPCAVLELYFQHSRMLHAARNQLGGLLLPMMKLSLRPFLFYKNKLSAGQTESLFFC